MIETETTTGTFSTGEITNLRIVFYKGKNRGAFLNRLYFIYWKLFIYPKMHVPYIYTNHN